MKIVTIKGHRYLHIQDHQNVFPELDRSPAQQC